MKTVPYEYSAVHHPTDPFARAVTDGSPAPSQDTLLSIDHDLGFQQSRRNRA
jgi:hypothetical protein